MERAAVPKLCQPSALMQMKVIKVQAERHQGEKNPGVTHVEMQVSKRQLSSTVWRNRGYAAGEGHMHWLTKSLLQE